MTRPKKKKATPHMKPEILKIKQDRKNTSSLLALTEKKCARLEE